MTLKRTITFLTLLSLASACLNLFGKATPPASPASNSAARPVASTDLDHIPVRTIAALTREWQSEKHSSNEIIHVRGAVLDQRVGEYLVIRDDSGTILAESSQTLAVKMQAIVDVWGRPDGDLNRLTLQHATFRIASTESNGTNDVRAQKPANLPLLTKVSQIRELSVVQSGWEYPVKIRAVVTLAYQHSRLYVEDDTAGIFVRARTVRANVKPGDLVEIEGTSNPGWYAPLIVPAKITVIGSAPLPDPPDVSLFQMASGQYDSQWVEDEAVVRDVKVADGLLQIKLSDRDGTFIDKIIATNAPANLLDSVVRVRGVCVSQFNNKRQITGVEMWTPSEDLIEVKEPAVSDAFSLPTQPIVSLGQVHARSPLQRRVKISGVVTACEPGKSFFVQDGDDGIEVFPVDKTTVSTGDAIDVAGYPALGNYGSVLRDAVIRVGVVRPMPAAKKVAKELPLDPQLNNMWVEAEGQVTSDPETDPTPVLTLQMGNTIFKAPILSPDIAQHMPPRGSVVRLSGVYQVLTDDVRAPRSFQIIVPSERYLEVLRRPASWTFQQTLLMVGALALIACLALLWVLLLRRKVNEQTAIWQQSEAKFRSLVEQSLVGVYVIQDGRFVYGNPRLAEIYGYPIEELTGPSLTVRDTVFPEDWPIVEEQIKRRMSGEISRAHYELRSVRKGGQVIQLEVMGSTGKYNGRLAILGTAMDITERKNAESKLAEASNLLETLLDNSPDCIYFKDRECRFMHFSKAFEKLFHVSDLQSVKGKTDFDYFKTDHAREAYEDEQEIIRTGKPLIGKLEAETHPDGRITAALTTKMPWRDNSGKIIGTFGISKDVTPLREAEAKLAYERDLLHALLENFPDVIYFKDLQSRFVRISHSKIVSARQTVLAKYRTEHPDAKDEDLPPHLRNDEAFGEWLIGKTDFDTYSEERARDAFEDEQKIIKTGEPILAKVERTEQADGAVTWCISTKMAWRDKDGRIIGTFGLSKDITELKRAESQLESAHQRLVETSRLAGMAEVASDVLHNVGNVLNSVNVSCSLTIDRVKAFKIAGLSKTATLIEENRNHLGEFFTKDQRGLQIPGYLATLAQHFGQEQSSLLQELEQLLKHIEHIKQIVAMQQSYAKVAGVIETINPTQLVDDAVHINGAALTRHDVQVRCDFQPVPLIQTEKHRVLQILVNLIRNAKYALDEAKRPDKLLTIKLGKNGGDHVKIEVIDNGVGIPPENLTRIFGHGFTTRRNGHGFGLHSSAIAINELGGSLTAHSDGVGKGATFTLLLPEKPPHAQELNEPNPTP